MLTREEEFKNALEEIEREAESWLYYEVRGYKVIVNIGRIAVNALYPLKER